MRRLFSKFLILAMTLAMLFNMTACGGNTNSSETPAETTGETSAETLAEGEHVEDHKIGVVVYDVNSDEVQMFRQYFEHYLGDNFGVSFVYSASVSDWTEEKAFLDAAIEDGVQGFISFNATNLPEAVAVCEASEVYYMIGSGNYSDDLLDQVKKNPWYLGCIGTSDKADYEAGADMAASCMTAAEKKDHIVVSTGGAAVGNYMHEMRARGVLEKLAELNGFKYEKSVDEMVMAQEPCEVGTGVDGTTIEICPGYDAAAKLEKTLGSYDADAVLSVLGFGELVSLVTAAEDNYGHDIWVGLVDCFSQWNRDQFNKTDKFGNPSLNYVTGKYASIVGPAFAAMYQAICADADMLRPNGEAFHLNQGFWTADNVEKYNELYGYTESFAKNAYSVEDLMAVISSYNADASYEAFVALTEAADVDSALARMNIE